MSTLLFCTHCAGDGLFSGWCSFFQYRGCIIITYSKQVTDKKNNRKNTENTFVKKKKKANGLYEEIKHQSLVVFWKFFVPKDLFGSLHFYYDYEIHPQCVTDKPCHPDNLPIVTSGLARLLTGAIIMTSPTFSISNALKIYRATEIHGLFHFILFIYLFDFYSSGWHWYCSHFSYVSIDCMYQSIVCINWFQKLIKLKEKATVTISFKWKLGWRQSFDNFLEKRYHSITPSHFFDCFHVLQNIFYHQQMAAQHFILMNDELLFSLKDSLTSLTLSFHGCSTFYCKIYIFILINDELLFQLERLRRALQQRVGVRSKSWI